MLAAQRTQTEPVHHILKGGEDSIGAIEAIQRVYFNIGSCAEQCWVNHITDLRQPTRSSATSARRRSTSASAGATAPNFRAIEDRLGDIVDFFLTAHADRSAVARARLTRTPSAPRTRGRARPEFGEGASSAAGEVFAANCARCHSSQEGGPYENRDFHARRRTTRRCGRLARQRPATGARDRGRHLPGRALHSNHMAGHVWEEYASPTLRARPADPNGSEPKGGGRGYYRNISLLSAWAHAPFMHNNAIGPEICGKPATGDSTSTVALRRCRGQAAAEPAACWPSIPSVEGRYELYKASMEDAAQPGERVPKITTLDADIVIDMAPELWRRQGRDRLDCDDPRGLPAVDAELARYKDLIQDLVLRTRSGEARAKYATLMSAEQWQAS